MCIYTRLVLNNLIRHQDTQTKTDTTDWRCHFYSAMFFPNAMLRHYNFFWPVPRVFASLFFCDNLRHRFYNVFRVFSISTTSVFCYRLQKFSGNSEYINQQSDNNWGHSQLNTCKRRPLGIYRSFFFHSHRLILRTNVIRCTSCSKPASESFRFLEHEIFHCSFSKSICYSEMLSNLFPIALNIFTVSRLKKLLFLFKNPFLILLIILFLLVGNVKWIAFRYWNRKNIFHK